MKSTRNITLTGLMIAIGLLIVSVLKNFGGQPILKLFSPMHFPVYIAGLAIGPIEGLITGLFTPLLSYLINQLPPSGPLAMMGELATYGLVCGLGMRYLPIKDDKIKILVSLIVAMLVGRIVGGIITAYILNAQDYSLSTWISAYFLGTLPAILAHLFIVPMIVIALKKAGLLK